MGNGSRGKTGGLLSALTLKESPEKIRDFLENLAVRGEVYLTGGAVRDILRGERVVDLDLTVVDLSPREVAKEAARRLSFALVPLHEEFGVFRVARGGFTIDISGLRPGARNLEEDLRLRDFTFNALAVPLSEALRSPPYAWPILDPCGGLSDLAKGLIRAISRENLLDDPLRLLRAYRFLACGYGRIEEETRKFIRELSVEIRRVAPERVEYEFRLIFETLRAGETLQEMLAVGLFPELFPELYEGAGVPQPEYHHLDVLGHGLESLSAAERILSAPEDYPEFEEGLRKIVSDSEALYAVKLAALFHDAGKSRTFSPAGERAERITFYEHEKESVRLFSAWAERWRVKKRVIKRASLLIRNHMRPFFLLEVREAGRLTPRAKRRILSDCPDLYGLFVVALADCLSARGPAAEPETCEKLRKLFSELKRFSREVMERVKVRRLVTGHDLIEIFGLKPGPHFRKLLSAVEEAQVEGRVRTRDEALVFLREMLKKGPEEGHA